MRTGPTATSRPGDVVQSYDAGPPFDAVETGAIFAVRPTGGLVMRMHIAAGLLLVSTSAMAAPGSSVGYEDGGSYYTYKSVVQQYNASGELFRIDGICQAACTLFLAIRNVCIGPNARLMFRAASENR